MQHPKKILEEHGLAASKHRGQNFLTQPATALAIARSAGLEPGQVAVEIGPGLGALTMAAAGLCDRVVAVELDRGVHKALQGILADQGVDNVDLRLGDALDLDWAALAAEAGGPLVVLGNLPYNITSPLLFKLIAARAHWKSATFMLQKEVTRRLAAPPGSKDYGRLSVMVQAFCGVHAGMLVGRLQFFPQPKVESQVVHLRPLERPGTGLESPEQEAWFARVVKAAFSQRRKTVANSLAGGLGLSSGDVAPALADAGLDPGLRAEKMDVEQLGRAARALAGLMK